MRWIDITERLPKKGYKRNVVGIYMPSFSVPKILAYDGKYFVDINSKFGDRVIITHWMPLPASPKGR